MKLSIPRALGAHGQARRSVLMGAGALLLASRGVRAAPAQLTAEQIVARNVQARGGAAAWHAVDTLSMSGLIDAGRIRPPAPENPSRIPRLRPVVPQEMLKGKMERLPFTLDLKRPRMMRMEITFEDQKAIQVFDGVHGWKLRPFLGRREVENYTPEEARASAQEQDLDGPLIDHTAKGIAVALEGMEPVEGHDAYKLKLTLRNGVVRRVWVDAQSFLDVMVDGERHIGNRTLLVHTHYRDFRKTGSVLMPYTLETKVKGFPDSETISVDKIVVNPSLPASLFTRPV